jgi:UDP-glucose 4-epimerase
MSILVSGGAGYIGSHACVELIKSGHDVIVVDNFSNSSKVALSRLEEITAKTVSFYEADIRDKEILNDIFKKHSIEGVIHFAGLKSVSESMSMPEKYYSNNVLGSRNLFEVMISNNCKNIIFSSSATVYGNPEMIPVNEECRLETLNPYGETKLVIEDTLRDLYAADTSWNIAMLRYFNPVGAHFSGLIGENTSGMPNNIMPIIMQVASGEVEELKIFGGDYNTKDGTGVRDYIHVVDLALAHVKALKLILNSKSNLLTANIGTGKGSSVLELINTFEIVSGKSIPYRIGQRRIGDVGSCYADPSFANKVLNWQAKYNLTKMCEDAWKWQCMNPHGYSDS